MLANHISKAIAGYRGVEGTNKQAAERRKMADGKPNITRFPDPPLGVRLCIFAFRGDAPLRNTHTERERGRIYLHAESGLLMCRGRAQVNPDEKGDEEAASRDEKKCRK